jgi:hypothetical protein
MVMSPVVTIPVVVVIPVMIAIAVVTVVVVVMMVVVVVVVAVISVAVLPIGRRDRGDGRSMAGRGGSRVDRPNDLMDRRLGVADAAKRAGNAERGDRKRKREAGADPPT